MAEYAGFLRMMTGTYTGTGSARTIDLGFVPKLICVCSDSGPDISKVYGAEHPTDNPVVLGNGGTKAERSHYYNEQGNSSYEAAKVKLSGSVLSFTGAHGTKLGNRSGVKYTWTAIY